MVEFVEEKVSTSIRMPKEDYEIWKRSGMKATSVFSFGLRYASLEYDLKIQTAANKKIQDALVLCQEKLLDAQDQIDLLNQKIENETKNRSE